MKMATEFVTEKDSHANKHPVHLDTGGNRKLYRHHVIHQIIVK